MRKPIKQTKKTAKKKTGIKKPTPLEAKKLSPEFKREIARMQTETRKTKDPLVRKLILQEIARRKQLLKEWQGDIRRG